MKSTFIEIPRERIENHLLACEFGRRVIGNEVVYVRHNHNYHSVIIKVWTSLSAHGGPTRRKGSDSIKVTVAYESEMPFRGRVNFGIYKTKRIFRVGTVQEVIDRMHLRMQEAYGFANEWIRNNLPNLPK